LSSGLTALQGTVASLQTAINAIEIPAATDVSGLATAENLATLSTALTTLAADVKELQDTLATAATAAEVAALQTALTAAQTDLTELLQANNIYTPEGSVLTISTPSQLSFAIALGKKLSIVNGGINITHTTSMNAADLATVMNTFTNITGTLTYTANTTGVTADDFDNLAAAGTIVINQKAPISLPSLASVNTLALSDNTGVTSVSLPKLAAITGSIGNMTFTRATSIDLSSLVRYDNALTVSIKEGTADFTALTSTDADGDELGHIITVNGAKTVIMPAVTGGQLMFGAATSVENLPVWEGNANSVFAEAKKVVLPKITGNVDIVLTAMAPEATYFHYIGNVYTSPTSSAVSSTYPSFRAAPAASTNDNVETLIIGGSSDVVNITDATDLTSLELTGSAHNVTIHGTKLSEATLAHTSKLGSVSGGFLTVEDNLSLTSLTADSLDDIHSLTISGNLKLETLSFAALNSLGTQTSGAALAATGSSLSITNNKLTAQSIQLPSATDALPVVDAKITTNSGITALSTYFTAHLTKRNTAAATLVELDDVVAVLNVSGNTVTQTTNVELAANAGLSTAAAVAKRQSWTSENDDIFLLNIAAGATVIDTPEVPLVKQKNTYVLAGAISGADTRIGINPNGTELASYAFSAANTAKITGYVATDFSTWEAAVETELERQITENGASFGVDIVNDWGRKATYDLNLLEDGIAGEKTGNNGKVLTFTFGAEAVATVGSSTKASLAEAIALAINNGGASDTYSAATVTGNKVEVTPLYDGMTNYNFTSSFPDFAFDAYSSGSSDTSFFNVSNTINTNTKVEDKGWRLTVINNSTSVQAANLESGNTFATVSSGLTLTALTLNTNVKASQTDIQAFWAVTTAYEAADTSNPTLRNYNLLTWL